MRLAVSEEVAGAFPGYRVGVIVASGLVNGPSVADAFAGLSVPPRDHPHIVAWREAFRAFGAKPKRLWCSAEALIARAQEPDGLPRINRLVDAYNAVSVRHAVPVGGEDLDAVVGSVRLVFASGDEPFDGGDPPRPGEVVWRDDVGVTCRRWNWRQGVRTRLSEATTRAYFLFDALPPLSDGELAAAMSELSGALRGPGVRLSSGVLAGAGELRL